MSSEKKEDLPADPADEKVTSLRLDDKTVPLRHKLVQTAVEFLTSPNVVDAATELKVSFLKKKGLTNEEIDLAFKKAESLKSKIGTEPVPPLPPLQPYYPPSGWSRFRDLANVFVLLGGFAYGVYWAYKNLIIPYFFGKKSKKSLDERLEELDTKVMTVVLEVSSNVSKMSEQMERGADRQAGNIGRQIDELKTELSSLKKLLLNRKQFPVGNVSIPSWQIPSDDKEAVEEEGAGSGTNGSDSSLEMIKE